MSCHSCIAILTNSCLLSCAYTKGFSAWHLRPCFWLCCLQAAAAILGPLAIVQTALKTELVPLSCATRVSTGNWHSTALQQTGEVQFAANPMGKSKR